MKTMIRALSVVLALAAAGSAMAADRTEVVKFKAGAISATKSSKIKGYDFVNYRLGASAGQVIQVLFSPSNRSCYFNVLAPGGNAVFNGSMDGNEYSDNLTRSGNYTVQVYLMRNAARRAETCKYSITFEISG